MARTALNVSDSFIAGLVSSKLLKEIDTDVYKSKV
jgi:L-cystine uptake protein TcyP (sodium:dicarboxylate symporter family)